MLIYNYFLILICYLFIIIFNINLQEQRITPSLIKENNIFNKTMYHTKKRNNQTTSTKCQYQADDSKPI